MGEDPLRHHGDVEVRGQGLLDLAVNVYPGPPPPWLSAVLHEAVEDAGSYPDPTAATAAVAALHGRAPQEVLVTAGAAEAFSLLARLRRWQRPGVVHPQFTEPHAALEQAGHVVTSVVLAAPFTLDPSLVPHDADLVVLGNPTNPTGVLHRAESILDLVRPGRLVVVDEAFMDAVPGRGESLASADVEGLLVIRSLTKHWGIPGVRAGYLLGPSDVVADLRRGQVPWSVSTAAASATVACCSPAAAPDATRRASDLQTWRAHLERGLAERGIEHVASSAPFVLVRVGEGVHARLRARGIAVRRADTFPGLGPEWVRVAARPPALADRFLAAVSELVRMP